MSIAVISFHEICQPSLHLLGTCQGPEMTRWYDFAELKRFTGRGVCVAGRGSFGGSVNSAGYMERIDLGQSLLH